MQITILAVGRMKRGPAAELTTEYLKRTRWNIAVEEIPDAPSNLPADVRRQREGDAIMARACDMRIVLDASGKQLTSPQLAALIQSAQKKAIKQAVFVIGGQDGLDARVLQSAAHVIAFGAVTWPHQLLRAMLAEQLYRAHTITVGHPYHSGH